ncbi:PEP-CTERM sorting domain-containing protein [Cylindrospermum sp. FACHB-282]|uniref:PEP-CTERM sorting domain-containing protein n=1 Tax=Cylindrospermum sp. FACHB-282 TaxID=2692794 RepID=UPI001685DF87|nr:PEP-CTERM sorting domain-containing protein [Cylindrospermum sp. FACHB-282]MBD2387335.1 PEP-CTERM sorting domain-containing protein [Cylindrospermum sp. FACHB-282]
MKLAKNLGFATATFALSLAAVSAQSAQAASIKYVGSSGSNTYNFSVALDNANEVLGAGSSWQVYTQGGAVTGSSVADTNSLFALGTNKIFNTIYVTAFEAKTQVTSANVSNFGFSLVSESNISSNFSTLFSIRPADSSAPTSPSVITTEDVPEPFTMGGSALALGMGWWMKRKKANLQNA